MTIVALLHKDIDEVRLPRKVMAQMFVLPSLVTPTLLILFDGMTSQLGSLKVHYQPSTKSTTVFYLLSTSPIYMEYR